MSYLRFYLIGMVIATCSLWGQKPDAIEDLAQRLVSAPQEIEAEGLLVLLEQGKVPVKLRREYLERASEVAKRLVMPSPMVAAVPRYARLGDSLPAVAMSAAGMGLNRLALQLRIEKLMGVARREEALEYLALIRPVYPQVTCQTELLGLPENYLRRVAQVGGAGLGAAEERVRIEMDGWLSARLMAQHEVELPGIVATLAPWEGPVDVRMRLLGSVAQQMGTIMVTFRGFWVVEPLLRKALLEGQRTGRLTGGQLLALWRGYAQYVERGVAAKRCGDVQAAEIDKRVQEIVSAAEGGGVPDEVMAGLRELGKKVSTEVDTMAPAARLFDEDGAYEALWPLYRELRFGPEERRKAVTAQRRPDGLIAFLPPEERRTVTWREQAERYLARIEEYAKLDHKNADEAFVKITSLYASLVEISLPGTPAFESTVGSLLAYVSGSGVMRTAPHVWCSEVRKVLRRATLDEHEVGLKEVRRMVRERGSAVLNVMMEVDAMRGSNSIW